MADGIERDIEERLRVQNELLHRLTRDEAIDSGDLAAAFRVITEAASEGLGVARVGVWLYADDTKDAMSSPDLYLAATKEHATAPLLSHTAFPTYFSELAKERVIPAGDAHVHPATAELSEAYLTPLGIGALLDAPIRFGGKMVGLVCHEHIGPARHWASEEISFAGAMADAVARAFAANERRIAAEKVRHTEVALKRQNAALHGLQKSEAIDSGDLETAFREITEAAAAGLDIDRVGVWLYADETMDAMSSPDLYLRKTNEHATAPLLSHTAFPTYFAELAKERVIPAGDAHTHPATAELSEAYLTPLGIGALLDAPIRFGGRMVGLVCNEHVGPEHHWTQEDINFAGAMADAVARAFSSNERRKAQEELEKVNRELETKVEERTRQLAASNDELRALHVTKDEMFQNVSHELRTPLTLILSPLTMLLENGDLDASLRPRLESMQRNSYRLLAQINDMLDLAKLDATGLSYVPRKVNVSGVVERLRDDIANVAEAKGVTLVVDQPTAAVWAKLDSEYLERILLNLLSNALKFTPAKGTVTVSVVASDAGLKIEVQDTGAGIPASAQEAIFERFSQVDAGTKRKVGGTGIGLALVQQLTELMGGSVDLESAEGKGATFSIQFPPEALTSEGEKAEDDAALSGLAKLSREAMMVAVDSTASQDVETAGERGPLVVIAEDEPEIRRELVDMLKAEHRVVACANGEVAFHHILKHQPHLVLSDVMMPKMDGLELAREIRSRPELRETALVLLSAKGAVGDRIEGRSIGVDAYLTKPFHPKEVMATIEGLMRSRMRLLGSYLVLERLGGGGQGDIFRAEHRDTGAPAAIKITTTNANQTGTGDLIKREKSALLRVTHDNIVRVLETGEEEERRYVAMELLEGVTAYRYVQRVGGLPASEICVFGMCLSSALRAIHNAGYVFRDLKGDNVMVLEGNTPLRERIRLFDFGAVSELSGEKSTAMIGTLSHMAPEILNGREATIASDVYSLGVFLFFALAGRLPYEGKSKDVLMREIRHDQAQVPADVRSRTPQTEQVAQLIERCLEKDLSKRFKTPTEVEHAFIELSHQHGWLDSTGSPVAAADDMDSTLLLRR